MWGVPTPLSQPGFGLLFTASRRPSAGGRVWGWPQPNHSGSCVTFVGGLGRGEWLRSQEAWEATFQCSKGPRSSPARPQQCHGKRGPWPWQRGHTRALGHWASGDTFRVSPEPLGQEARPGRFLRLRLVLSSLPTLSGHGTSVTVLLNGRGCGSPGQAWALQPVMCPPL